MKKRLITHNGSFHADDVFAAAALSILLEKKEEEFSAKGATPARLGGQGPASGWEIIRTREPDIIEQGDYVFDVGGVYDAERNRFDHHQPGGAGRRASGIEYASFGLVWKKFGTEIAGGKREAEMVDERLVAPIDAFDNGTDLGGNEVERPSSPYLIQHAFFALEPTWRESVSGRDGMFLHAVEIARTILLREIVHARDFLAAEKEVKEIYDKTEDKRIIILDKKYPVDFVLSDFPEPLFVVYPMEEERNWGVKAVRNDPKSFKNRKNFPAEWSGLRDGELRKITGVSDAVFCHRGLFLCVARSKESAIKLAKLALGFL